MEPMGPDKHLWAMIKQRDPKFLQLICDATDMLVSGDDPVLRILAEQWALAKPHLEEGALVLTGVGFFYQYQVPEPLRRIPTTRLVLSDLTGYVNGRLVFLNLFVNDGKLDVLEGATIDEWPEVIEEYTLFFGREPGCPRDLDRLRKYCGPWPKL
ncbi:hypothetical protein HRbin36_02541 [bacterium HR36]|nr:hypothetical protein HRbin36_02541 [bacterium HR36]